MSLTFILRVPNGPSSDCVCCKNCGTCCDVCKVNSSLVVHDVIKDNARPVIWNSLRIGCLVCGAIGRPLCHLSFLTSGYRIFFALKIAYGVLKFPLLSKVANLSQPLFLYSRAQCLIMSLWSPLNLRAGTSVV